MKKIFILIFSIAVAGELEVDGDLKVGGSVVFQDESSINTAPSGMPAGVIMPYAGTTPPDGWLLCYGQEISRSEYAELFSAVLITYGEGDHITTFNLPDLRGRMIIGIDSMGGISADRVENSVADSLGGSDGTEMQTYEMNLDNPITGGPNASGGYTGGGSWSNGGQFGGHTHNVSLTQPDSQSNMPPYLSLNYIIKY